MTGAGRSLLRFVVLGAVLGGALGAAGYWRADVETGAPYAESVGNASITGAIAGIAAGIALFGLRGFLGKGGLAHYLSWGAAGVAGGVAFALSSDGAVPWGDLVFVTGLGGFCGLGLGAVARQIQGHWW